MKTTARTGPAKPRPCEDFETACNLPLAAQRGVGHTDRRRRRGRVAEGGGLLNRYRVVKPYRGFESLRLRQPIFSITWHRSSRPEALRRWRGSVRFPPIQNPAQSVCSPFTVHHAHPDPRPPDPGRLLQLRGPDLAGRRGARPAASRRLQTRSSSLAASDRMVCIGKSRPAAFAINAKARFRSRQRDRVDCTAKTVRTGVRANEGSCVRWPRIHGRFAEPIV